MYECAYILPWNVVSQLFYAIPPFFCKMQEVPVRNLLCTLFNPPLHSLPGANCRRMVRIRGLRNNNAEIKVQNMNICGYLTGKSTGRWTGMSLLLCINALVNWGLILGQRFLRLYSKKYTTLLWTKCQWVTSLYIDELRGCTMGHKQRLTVLSWMRMNTCWPSSGEQ